jgi:PTH1 family peptidyl-tRNA hydrolase
MWCVVGLGNPGAKHAHQRHNIGFMAVDRMAQSVDAPKFSAKFQGQVAQARIADQPCLLLKPQTFMNLSGKSVQAAAGFYKIPPEKIIVLHDELALNLGKLRIKQGGGHNGHNGLRDIDQHIGKNYWRMRLGIAHPGDKDRVSQHVLSDFAKDEQAPLADFLDDLTRYFPLFFSHSPEGLMSKMAPEPEAKIPTKTPAKTTTDTSI